MFSFINLYQKEKCVTEKDKGTEIKGDMEEWKTVKEKGERRETDRSNKNKYKPDCEGQIPYDLTFNWNRINRRKKANKI